MSAFLRLRRAWRLAVLKLSRKSAAAGAPPLLWLAILGLGLLVFSVYLLHHSPATVEVDSASGGNAKGGNNVAGGAIGKSEDPATLEAARRATRGWQVVTEMALAERDREKQRRANAASGDEWDVSYKRTTTKEKQDAVVEAMRHTIKGYREKAWGHDEIRPTTNETNDSWGHFGVTIVDSLDTMYMMGLKEDFALGVEHVRQINFDSDVEVSVFETTIRLLGGLLSAYDLSGEEILLTKAKELGDRLLPAFGTHLPYSVVNMRSGNAHNYGWTGGASILAEFGSVQMEMKHLSALTGDPKYGAMAEQVMDAIAQMPRQDGLYDVLYNPISHKPTPSKHFVSFGGLGDSFYEYLLKQWLISNRTEPRNLQMYNQAIDGLVEHLVFQSRPSYLTYVSELRNGQPTHVMEHLACFVPGMLLLGANEHEPDMAEKHRNLAKLLLDTCIHLGEDSPSGLPPDSVKFWTMGGGTAENYQISNAAYLLRPETVESMFYMYRLTGDESFRRHGWRLWQAIEKYCKTTAAYSGVVNVRKMPPEQNNSMQSFFLAETLKYFYLLFSDDPNVIPLGQFVFTTEAHPLRVHRKEQINWT